MQIDSRIHISLKSHELWNELKSIDFQKYNICTDWIKDGKNSLVLDDWYCDDSNAKELVTKISDILGTDAMVFYDSSSTSVDPYAHLIYSVGLEVHEKEFDFDEFCYEQDNRDLCAYLSYKRFFTFSKEELAVLKKFGIEQEKGKKHSFQRVKLKKLIDDEIIIKVNDKKESIEKIENLSSGDLVNLVLKKDNIVNVIFDGTDIGTLDTVSAKAIKPFINNCEVDYIAQILNVLPLSKCPKAYNMPIVTIHIDV